MPPASVTSAFSRAAFRQTAFAAQTRAAFERSTLRARYGPQGGPGRRWQSTTADGGAAQSWFKRMWDSPVGLKTVHFWAPVMKWALVLAGISDLSRPAEKLSLMQNGALTATGLIWTRWCTIITPKNYLLGAVNFFLALVGIAQCTRIFFYRQSLKGQPAAASAVNELKSEAKAIKEEVKEAVKA